MHKMLIRCNTINVYDQCTHYNETEESHETSFDVVQSSRRKYQSCQFMRYLFTGILRVSPRTHCSTAFRNDQAAVRSLQQARHPILGIRHPSVLRIVLALLFNRPQPFEIPIRTPKTFFLISFLQTEDPIVTGPPLRLEIHVLYDRHGRQGGKLCNHF